MLYPSSGKQLHHRRCGKTTEGAERKISANIEAYGNTCSGEYLILLMSGTGPAEPKRDRESSSPVSEQD